MLKKSPWSKRASSQHISAEADETRISTHTRLLDVGWYIQIMVVCGLASAFVALVVVRLSPSQQLAKDDPYAPGFWEVSLPILGKIILIAGVCSLIGVVVHQIAKRRLKNVLLSTRCQRCTQCFYDLSNRSRDEDVCSECGSFTPRRECVRLWCKLLRSRF